DHNAALSGGSGRNNRFSPTNRARVEHKLCSLRQVVETPDRTGEQAMNRVRRSNFLIDREVQGAMMLRVILYWNFCILTISLMLICWNAYQGPARPFSDLIADI